MKYLVVSIKTALFALILYTLYVILHTGSAHAENFESQRYRIQFGTINTGGDTFDSANYNLTHSLGQSAAEEFQSTGYLVKAGFQYIYSIIPFRFSVSDISIQFGTVSPNTFHTQTTNLTVSFGGAGQYAVTAQEMTPLRRIGTLTDVPDTTCNGGGDTCNHIFAKTWNSTSAYGFGYNMSGNDVSSDFSSSDHYRAFADASSGEAPVDVMTSNNVGRNRQSTMTFKINISPVQPAGSYQTVIKLTATPSY